MSSPQGRRRSSRQDLQATTMAAEALRSMSQGAGPHGARQLLPRSNLFGSCRVASFSQPVGTCPPSRGGLHGSTSDSPIQNAGRRPIIAPTATGAASLRDAVGDPTQVFETPALAWQCDRHGTSDQTEGPPESIGQGLLASVIQQPSFAQVLRSQSVEGAAQSIAFMVRCCLWHATGSECDMQQEQ
jgi:hypothetical protein